MQPHPLRHRRRRLALVLSLTALFTSALTADTIRVATFNASLNRSREGALLDDLRDPSRSGARQVKRVAEILQATRPDIVLLNEFDHDPSGEGMRLFQENFLSVGQGDQEPLAYAHRYSAPSNTGIASEMDLDNNRRIVTTIGSNEYAGDAFGFGQFPGQYGMVLYSQYPLRSELIRTFQTFLWRDMPEALLPDGSNDTPNWYTAEESARFRLSSKSHWDVPIEINGSLLHVLMAHPTPPVFDGREDRNGRRNHDEIRFWADYIAPGRATYHYDDSGLLGGLAEGERFVILGDLNADPNDGDSVRGAIAQLLDHPLVQASPAPQGPGGKEGADANHRGNPAEDTADFSQENLRADYVLPSRSGLTITHAEVFWPERSHPLSTSVRGASDHRLVFVDLEIKTTTAAPLLSQWHIERQTDQVILRWRGRGASYAVEWSNDLQAPWQSDPAITLKADGDSWEAIDRVAEKRRFYRVLGK